MYVVCSVHTLRMFSYSASHSSTSGCLKLVQEWLVLPTRTLNPLSNHFVFCPPNSAMKLSALFWQYLQLLTLRCSTFILKKTWHHFQCPYSMPSLIWILTVKWVVLIHVLFSACFYMKTLTWVSQVFKLESFPNSHLVLPSVVAQSS